MHVVVCTLFPELFAPFLREGLMGKAIQRGVIRVDLLHIRVFSNNKHNRVDDVPYGGGPGMVMKPEPLVDCLQAAHEICPAAPVVYLSPQGKPLTQRRVEEISHMEGIILLNGRYEGIDERIIERYVDEEISIGDYVLYGGELGSMVILEAVTRLLPDGLGNRESLSEESLESGRLEYPQYTRPLVFDGLAVPDVLVSGHHARIARWRRKQSLLRTIHKRPDLIEKYPLTSEEIALLEDPNI